LHGPVAELAAIGGAHVEAVSDGGELALLAFGGAEHGDMIGGVEAAITPVWRGEARQVGRLTADENRQTPH